MTCTVCECAFQDQNGVGCEAEEWTNTRSYVGLALTHGERALGFTSMDKMLFVFGGPGRGLAADEVLAGFDRWREKVEREAERRWRA